VRKGRCVSSRRIKVRHRTLFRNLGPNLICNTRLVPGSDLKLQACGFSSKINITSVQRKAPHLSPLGKLLWCQSSILDSPGVLESSTLIVSSTRVFVIFIFFVQPVYSSSNVQAKVRFFCTPRSKVEGGPPPPGKPAKPSGPPPAGMLP